MLPNKIPLFIGPGFICLPTLLIVHEFAFFKPCCASMCSCAHPWLILSSIHSFIFEPLLNLCQQHLSNMCWCFFLEPCQVSSHSLRATHTHTHSGCSFSFCCVDCAFTSRLCLLTQSLSNYEPLIVQKFIFIFVLVIKASTRKFIHSSVNHPSAW